MTLTIWGTVIKSGKLICDTLSSSDCDVAEVDGSGTGVCPTDAGYDYRA